MSKKSTAAPAVAKAAGRAPAKAEVFSFGDPEPVMSRRDVLDHMECWRNGRWYSPPINLNGLSRTRFASPHHASAMALKVNMLVSHFIPHPWLSRQIFEGVALDFVTLANGYVERLDNIAGRPMRLERPLGRYMRRGIEPGAFFQLNSDQGQGVLREHAFEPGSVLQIMAPDLNQEIYGVPEYLGALQSTFLNEAATIFRRRYYQNGSHAGFILYATDEQLESGDVDTLRQALKDSKGPGNFRNVMLYAPGGKKDGLQLIPISEVAAKDEFLGIKNTSRDDVLASHRVPPQLLGIVPANAGGFGDVGKAADVFYEQEIVPLQGRFEVINDWLGTEVVRFRPYERRSAASA
ncbi:phage portal protein [Brevundimonas nasdae]|uniref:phage portal protein n=1 Tax=Brevundimonas nasdae TaxID=172043 RepID=UPI003F693FAA